MGNMINTNTYLEIRYNDKTRMHMMFESSALALAAIDGMIALKYVTCVYVETSEDCRKLELIENTIITSFVLNILNLKQFFT